MIVVIVLMLVSIISAFICYYIAWRKGLHQALWTALGAFLGPLGVALVLFARSKTP